MDDTDTIKKILTAIFEKRQNILLTGSGGCGKSKLLRDIIEYADGRGRSCHATASTGVAAVNINGRTLHSFSGIGLGKESAETLLENLKTYNPKAVKTIKNADLLIIDEISMINGELFDKLDWIYSQLRRNSVQPFGGIQMVLSGDFLQLPPVEGSWVFQSHAYKALKLKPFILTEAKRFDDMDFFQTLSRARKGQLTDEDDLKIKGRVQAYQDYIETLDPKDFDKIKPTLLYSHKVDVESINLRELNNLPSEMKKYVAKDIIVPKSNYATRLPTVYKDTMNAQVQAEILLKVGSQVMLIQNLNLEEGLCNGSRGIITKMEADSVTVKFIEAGEIQIGMFRFEYEDDFVNIIRTQIPLQLAFASTIHKSQGSTLDYCVIDLGTSIFAYGQAYVALSRARNWNSVLINYYTRKSFKADPQALEYMATIEKET